jgi:dephospho-CoA kinase
MRNRISRRKLFIGVTGGIGSGKTLACKYLEKLGCKIFYADEIARSLYSTNFDLKKKLVKEFGKSILDKSGSISFGKLREIVFSSNKEQVRVNRIVHPFVISELIRRAKSHKSKIIAVEAALIFESGFNKYLDFTVEIYSSVNSRIERVRERKKLTVSQIRSVIRLQMPEKEKIKLADFIIKNNSTRIELKRKVEFLHFILTQLL